MSKAAFAAILLVWCTATSPAWACPGPSAERYLLWFDLPELLPGEIAVEVDLKDTIQYINGRARLAGPLKVSRVIVGDFAGDVVHARRDGSNCAHDVGGGVTGRLVLIGKLEAGADSAVVLTPRYMPYTHPFAVVARRELEDRAQAIQQGQ